MDNPEKFIHLLYVPTMSCNMRCKYCYLGDGTVDSDSSHGCFETLSFAVEKLLQAGVMPFNISLHGGEVTCLSKQDFRRLILLTITIKTGHFLSRTAFALESPTSKPTCSVLTATLTRYAS